MKNEKTPGTVRYFYLRDDERRPVAVIAHTVVDATTLKWAYSVCNPVDTFTRARGRMIATARLMKENDGNRNPFVVYVRPDETRRVALKKVCETLAELEGEVPKRVRRLLAGAAVGLDFVPSTEFSGVADLRP